MKNRLTLLVGLILALVLLTYMFAYQVRYDQVAVLTTFDKASDGGVQREPGLYFKAPWPIQKVQHYSTRLQLLESPLEQTQTLDDKPVIVRAYLAWRIEDPLTFFVKLQDMVAGRDKLMPLLSGVISGVIGQHTMDQLVNTDPQQLKLEQIESDALAHLREQLSNLGYGIRAEHLGIIRLQLPQETTAKVFETMRKTRRRLASHARSSGQAEAETIKSQARAAKRRIIAFAQRRAQAIRAQGDKQAAQYYRSFQEDESLAIFLRRIEALKKVLPHNSTFILDADQLSLERVLASEPGVVPRGGAPLEQDTGAAYPPADTPVSGGPGDGETRRGD